jgi:carbonic anhydrase/acetyltransferase-like protein (isoleucine patch superfamily)
VKDLGMNTKLLIVGSGPVFEEAGQVAASLPDMHVETMELFAADRFNFEIPDLSAYPPDMWRLFIALDDRGLNMSRMQLVAVLKGRGYKLHRLVAPGAHVSASTIIGENTLILWGAAVGGNSKLGLNVVVGAGARVAGGCKIGNGVYLDVGCVVGREVELGDYVTVGVGAVVHDEAKIGRYCELRRPMTYRGRIPDKTFYLDVFENPVSIISPF